VYDLEPLPETAKRERKSRSKQRLRETAGTSGNRQIGRREEEDMEKFIRTFKTEARPLEAVTAMPPPPKKTDVSEVSLDSNHPNARQIITVLQLDSSEPCRV
jgi:hypothetical protein